ncbi:MAG: DSD1 family PLP-dependent enzyme [Comamonadaceae bacterium]|nr:MAG: DSD1 family PLP-dependent enzyme [Comamonadaceae bacterium]
MPPDSSDTDRSPAAAAAHATAEADPAGIAALRLALASPARPGDRLDAVDTPSLLLDLDAFDRNLDRMQAAADAAGVALRPHAKAHKCPRIASAQLARGAVGICCQKAGEALPFIEAGVTDIHISNELASPAKAHWLAHAARHARLSVCVDDPGQIDALGEAVRMAGTRLGVFVELEVGQGRCGVAGADAVLRLLDSLARHAGLAFRGLQAYHGGAQHLRGQEERRAAAGRAAERTGRVVDALAAAGVRCGTVTGGGTGSVEFDLASGVYTEVQPGSYVFMDRDYADNHPGEGTLRFEHALYLATTVMSTAVAGRVVVDAGLKSLAVDSGLPALRAGRGLPEGLAYLQANDEHGIVAFDAGSPPGSLASDAALPALGSMLQLIPGHCDPTLNLHDVLVCVRGERVEAVWPISARGLSR